MFLPVLLIRDYGAASFFIFAVPNVMGAMLMGIFLQRPRASEELVRGHWRACWWFSWITSAFQVFVLLWVLLDLVEPRAGLWAFGGAAVVLAVVWLTARRRSADLLATGVLLASLAAAAIWLWLDHPVLTTSPQRMSLGDVAGLAPVCLLGFALCPYLDLTFHKARQRLPGAPGSLAFVIGFGVMFLAMIVLTFLYAGPLLARAESLGVAASPALLAAPLLVHLGGQLAFTTAIHNDQIAAGWGGDMEPRGWEGRATAFMTALGLAALARNLTGTYVGLHSHEFIYRVFMAFYGLVFPAYVWLCIVGRGRRTGWNLAVFAVAVAAATPFYWMGFIERRTWWLGPGVLLVVAARLLTRPARSTPAPVSHASAAGSPA